MNISNVRRNSPLKQTDPLALSWVNSIFLQSNVTYDFENIFKVNRNFIIALGESNGLWMFDLRRQNKTQIKSHKAATAIF